MARPKRTKAGAGGAYSQGSAAFVVATRQSRANQQGVNHAYNAFPYAGFRKAPDEVHLTMAQEARNTERYTSRRSNLNLRYNEIRFVSAGDLVQESLEVPNAHDITKAPNVDPPSTMGERDLESECRKWLNNTVEVEADQAGAEEERGVKEAGEKVEGLLDADRDSQDIFFIDREGEDPAENMRSENSTVALNVCMTALSVSSEDEVVFTGRGNRSQRPPVHRSQNLNPSRQHGPSILDDPFIPSCWDDGDDYESVISGPESASNNESDPAIIHTSESTLLHPAGPPEFINLNEKEKRSHARKPRRRRSRWDSDDSEILADYIANMMDDNTSDEGEDEGKDAGIGQVHVQNQNKSSHSSTKSWNSADLEDLNDLSSSDELPDEIGRIFSMREKGKSIQYLLTGVGQSVDKARWIRKELLTMPSASELIRRFEENVALIEPRREKVSEPSSDPGEEEEEEEEEEEKDGDDEDDDEEEFDQDLHDGMKQDLNDEQMARLLQTQDSFGLGTDDFLLLDGNGGFGGFDNFSRPKFSYGSSLSKPKKRRNRNGHFPSASAFADALDKDPYGGFDVMDFDRPSLRKKPKGRRHAHQYDFDLSDSDLVRELQASWENDRNKKKAKKQEREELRAQGLLGTKYGKIDMKAKYTEGMSIDDVKLEIRAFLASSSQSLSLPPMDKRNRKLVHEIANILLLKSISRGSGTSRFPILTKTSRTPTLDSQAAVHRVDRIFSSGRFMRRMDRPSRGDGGGFKPVAKSRGGGGGVKAASYMDGDVVGASAPEIGAGNKGRAMLEKMGWSTGTALGAVNNKGILHPVVHVVKNSKAGLG
ncbi:G-patch and R3H domain-containing protein c [Histoplasma capsulatum G186AR]|uniref:Protein SQS1 n=2 Tax=Ajellomyces capsulatus TaxID=5037 RepID=C0NZ96_AJECG|nr:G-patch and R3H domain-containing protein c [Histoplasma capsulatum G186AR]EEH03144.1 G-patch and R3H domain-containing protein c [Histoplasma capsulatum G186AR]KAG5290453.1 G-patch and R3H domain-containing protein c [Histoplasma capsulatum]QSS72381.1 G-patch and R3H domain-containing protein c [Histoplasma capsulatum G186AR]